MADYEIIKILRNAGVMKDCDKPPVDNCPPPPKIKPVTCGKKPPVPGDCGKKPPAPGDCDLPPLCLTDDAAILQAIQDLQSADCLNQQAILDLAEKIQELVGNEEACDKAAFESLGGNLIQVVAALVAYMKEIRCDLAEEIAAAIEALGVSCEGLAGSKGDMGPTGPAGPRGKDGLIGPQGPRGEQGPPGPQGLPGCQGAQGMQGLQGERGPAGVQGPPGPAGPRGEDGRDGRDGSGFIIRDIYETECHLKAYHPVGAVGDAYMVGSCLYIWSAKSGTWENVGPFKGPKGENGSPGPKGSTGPEGPEGPPGAKGDGFVILDVFDTREELESSHPTGNIGDAYLVGNHLYIWSESLGDWKDVGPLQGPAGPTGPPGQTAYQLAGSLGFPGSESEFNDLICALFTAGMNLADLEERMKVLENLNGIGEEEDAIEWELYYTMSNVEIPSMASHHIPLENWSGFDGTQLLPANLYETCGEDFELWVNNPGAGGSNATGVYKPATAVKVPFNRKKGNPASVGEMKQWGFDSKTGDYGAITIDGNSNGYWVPMRLVKKKSKPKPMCSWDAFYSRC